MNKLLTIIIPSYRSGKLILSHIKNLSNKYKIIIIENSYDLNLKKKINDKYPNVSVYLKKNIGYGRAVNFASKKVKTKYFFVMNPDVVLFKNTIKNLILAANKFKEFGALGPIYENEKKKYKYKFNEVNKIVSAAMLINTKMFIEMNGYDEKFFLYYEDDDFFLKCQSLNLKLFLLSNSIVKHKKIKIIKKTLNLHSTTFLNYQERDSTYVVGGWHGQWSKFYFLKKHNGFFYAFLKCLPSNLLNFLQIIPYVLYNPIKAKYKYFKIEGFLCSLFGMPSFKRSIFDIKKFNI